jgi:hypothetical protein
MSVEAIMTDRTRRIAVLAVAGLLLMVACESSMTTGDGGAGDVERWDGAGWDLGDKSCPATPCPAGYTCHSSGICIKDQGKCASDDECQGDTFCSDGSCIPYGPSTKTHDPDCKGGGFTAEKFEAPTEKCKWTSSAVIMSPVVVDLDGDQKPEIVFVTFTGAIAGGHLVAIRGDTCQQVFDTAASLGTRSQLAVADLDGDKVPEIVGITGQNHVVVFSNTGQQLAISTTAAQTGPSMFKDGGAAIANLDGQGPPEIVYAGMALRFENNALTTLYNVAVQGGHWGVLSAVADVDLDGKPEVVVGNKILDGLTGADKTPAPVKAWPAGYVAIAEFDKSTPEPEVVLISSQTTAPGTIRIYHPKTGNVVFGPYNFGQKWGGPPTVADFDGDNQPEVAAAGFVGYALFDPECAKTPLPSTCHAPGIRWLKQTKDNSSGSTGSSVFDFNGDGAAEVVYRDECWLRVYDGKTGKVRFARSISSGTILELPVIADVDNDGHADLVVPSHQVFGAGYCETEPELGLPPGSGTQGIFVLQDPKNRWMPSRAIWNQHTYHITNVNDDATIPVTETHNWLSWNNYRQNTQGMIKGDAPAPDLTGGENVGVDPTSDCTSTWVLMAKICNRGASKAPAGIPGTFYKGDPRAGGTVICSTATTKTLDPGECEAVKCAYENPPKETIDLWFAADDDGTGGGKETECKEKNNLLHLPEASCATLQ